jgi:hypothetical protein
MMGIRVDITVRFDTPSAERDIFIKVLEVNKITAYLECAGSCNDVYVTTIS